MYLSQREHLQRSRSRSPQIVENQNNRHEGGRRCPWRCATVPEVSLFFYLVMPITRNLYKCSLSHSCVWNFEVARLWTWQGMSIHAHCSMREWDQLWSVGDSGIWTAARGSGIQRRTQLSSLSQRVKKKKLFILFEGFRTVRVYVPSVPFINFWVLAMSIFTEKMYLEGT